MLYFLTPTGGRAEGLSLLGEYINAQTYSGEATWIIVDDCEPASFLPVSRFNVVSVRPDWRWKPGQNTQGKSLLAGLALVPPDARLFVLEDDDCYLPEYIEAMNTALDFVDLAGEKESRYYNINTKRYKVMQGNGQHASLMCTAMKGAAIEAFKKACEDGRNIDMTLWRNFKGEKFLLDGANTVGIKGLPGRGGIGVGHKATFGVPDDSGVLESWIGEYARNYE